MRHAAPHVHAPAYEQWNWAGDRIDIYCVCGAKWEEMADGPTQEPDVADFRGTVVNPENCGLSWITDIYWGLVVFGLAFGLVLLALFVSSW